MFSVVTKRKMYPSSIADLNNIDAMHKQQFMMIQVDRLIFDEKRSSRKHRSSSSMNSKAVDVSTRHCYCFLHLDQFGRFESNNAEKNTRLTKLDADSNVDHGTSGSLPRLKIIRLPSSISKEETMDMLTSSKPVMHYRKEKNLTFSLGFCRGRLITRTVDRSGKRTQSTNQSMFI